MQQTFTREELSRKEYILTISSKGQVTLPLEVRQALGLKQNEKVRLLVENQGEVRLQVPQYPNVDSVVGKAGKLPNPTTWKELEEIAADEAVISEYHD